MNQNLTGVMAFTANGQKFGHFTANNRFYPWRLKKINGLFFLRLAVEICQFWCLTVVHLKVNSIETLF